jgi:hypothetical protein
MDGAPIEATRPSSRGDARSTRGVVRHRSWSSKVVIGNSGGVKV